VDDSVPFASVVPMLYPRDEELVHQTVTQFMLTDAFSEYIDDGEVCE